MRSLLLTGLSITLTATVIGNAYYQKKQFYPSVVYITKSNPSMAVIYIQALVFVVLTGKMLRALFFGQLRDAEMEHLIERSWYAVTETCLAFTVFRDDFSPRFVALFTLLLFLKCFHWLAEDRIDYMERSPTISWLFHLRALSLMFVLGFLDIMFVNHAFYSTLLKGPSVQLVFGFEYEILFTVVLMIFIKYVLHTIDLQSQNPWDNKAVYLLYSELIMSLIRVVLYVAFVIIMIKVHTFPLFAIRPMYLTVRAFQKAAQDVILSRRAIRNMNTLYPDATPEELSSGDNVCIICREEMTTGCKKLPCNHIFHTSCLRSWFQRQQTCPTCRLEVLRMPRAAAAQPAQPQQPQQPPQPPADNQNPFNNMPGMFGGFPFQWPPNGAGQAVPPPFGWPPQQQQQQQGAAGAEAAATTQAQTQAQAGAATSSAPSGSSTSTSTSSSATPGTPPLASMAPPFPGAMPFMPPMMPPMFSPFSFPPPPVPMAGLNEEELRAMEGVERTNVEARVQWLRDIQALLDGAMLLIGQYNTVASHMGTAGINTAPTAPAPPPAGPPTSSPATSSSTPSSSSVASSTSSTSSSSLSSSSSAAFRTAQPQDVNVARASPHGEGARPKYTSVVCGTHTTDSPERARSSSISQDKDKPLEGAVGGGTETVEDIPKWENPRDEGHEDEMHEVRKRRLQHFSQQQGSSDAGSADGKGGDKASNAAASEEQH